MKFVAGEIPGMVLKRSQGIDTANLSLDLSLSNLVWALDGIRTIEAIAREDGYNLDVLVERAGQLLAMGLVEKVVDNSRRIADHSFVQELTRQLSTAIGPIADLLIEDIAQEMGLDLNSFPLYQLDNFIALLSKEIRQKEKADTFVENMRDFIKEKYRSR